MCSVAVAAVSRLKSEMGLLDLMGTFQIFETPVWPEPALVQSIPCDLWAGLKGLDLVPLEPPLSTDIPRG